MPDRWFPSVGTFWIVLQDDARRRGNIFFATFDSKMGGRKKSYYKNINNLGRRLSENGKRRSLKDTKSRIDNAKDQ